MSKYQLLIDYYYHIADILRDRLPHIPNVQLTYGKTYYGSYWKKDGRSAVSLSVVRCWPIDRDEVVDTICHELAHTIWPEHNQLHTAATKHFIALVNQVWSKVA